VYSELDTDFRQAAEDVKHLSARPDNDTLLKLYALYKQATDGDVCGPKPGFFDFVNTAKYEAGHACAACASTTRNKNISSWCINWGCEAKSRANASPLEIAARACPKPNIAPD